MAFIVKSLSPDIEPIPAGTYQGICYGIIDLGMQYSEVYKKASPKILFLWELLGTQIEVDNQIKRRVISKQYTASISSNSNLNKDIKSWTGRELTKEELDTGFDISRLLGMNCFINISVDVKENGKKINGITSIMALPINFPTQAPENEKVIYQLDSPDEVMFNKLPQWIKDRIQKAKSIHDIDRANTGEMLTFNQQPIPNFVPQSNTPIQNPQPPQTTITPQYPGYPVIGQTYAPQPQTTTTPQVQVPQPNYYSQQGNNGRPF